MVARRNGFTLIEMLIAMTLLGVMVVLLFSSLKIAAESWNAGEGKIVEVNRKAVVYQFFKRHLTTIRPVMMQAKNDDDAAPAEQAFQGQAQSMRFVAALPASSARKGLQIFDIAADPGEPSTIRVTLSPYQQTDQGEVKPEVLLQHVKTFVFLYFGKKTEDETENGNWQEDWTGAERLPQLIKVKIELDDGSFWPDMVFPLKIMAQAAVGDVAPDDNELDSQASQ